MPEVYTHGHHESVLRSHKWRTAENSAAYLLPHLAQDAKVLDVGCGPGTITADLADRVPEGHVTGIDSAQGIIDQARETVGSRTNLGFATGDVYALDYPDGSFDVVHAHQVLQHLGDPVRALREMRRVIDPERGRVAIYTTALEAKGSPAAPYPLATRGHFYEDDELVSLARKAGFREARIAHREPWAQLLLAK